MLAEARQYEVRGTWHVRNSVRLQPAAERGAIGTNHFRVLAHLGMMLNGDAGAHEGEGIYREGVLPALQGVDEIRAGKEAAYAQRSKSKSLGECARYDQIGIFANPRQNGLAGEILISFVHQNHRAGGSLENGLER